MATDSTKVQKSSRKDKDAMMEVAAVDSYPEYQSPAVTAVRPRF